MSESTTRRRRRNRPVVETDEFLAFARRIMRRAAERAGDAHEHLGELAELGREYDRLLATAVVAARAQGVSWSEIGRQLGTSKQNVQQRFGGPVVEIAPRRRPRPVDHCVDCGELGELTGHMSCQYPGRVSEA